MRSENVSGEEVLVLYQQFLSLGSKLLTEGEKMNKRRRWMRE